MPEVLELCAGLPRRALRDGEALMLDVVRDRRPAQATIARALTFMGAEATTVAAAGAAPQAAERPGDA